MSDKGDLAKIRRLIEKARDIEEILADENIFPDINFRREYLLVVRNDAKRLQMSLRNIELLLPKKSTIKYSTMTLRRMSK